MHNCTLEDILQNHGKVWEDAAGDGVKAKQTQKQSSGEKKKLQVAQERKRKQNIQERIIFEKEM